MIRTLNVVINGAAGNIAYALLPLFCNGLVFGKDIKINLHLLEIPRSVKKLRGTIMEIKDGSYPALNKVHMDFDTKSALTDAHLCIFIGGVPHKKGMERADLLKGNLKIYKNIARQLNRYASDNCKVLAVVNPVNSLTSIMSRYCPRLSPRNFTGLSRLDYNRGRNIIAEKCSTNVENVKNLIIWGNHSDTQFADTSKVKVGGIPLTEIVEQEWLNTTFVKQVASRWKEIVNSRGITSVLSPANAIKDHIKDWFFGTDNDSISMGVIHDGEHYNIPKGMCFSSPVKTENFDYKFVNYDISEFTAKKITDSIEEIQKELDGVGFKI